MFLFNKRFTKMLSSSVTKYLEYDSHVCKSMLELYEFYEGDNKKRTVCQKCSLYRLILEKKFSKDKVSLDKFSKKNIYKIYIKGNPYGFCCEMLSQNHNLKDVLSSKIRILKIIKNDCNFEHCDILNGADNEDSHGEH